MYSHPRGQLFKTTWPDLTWLQCWTKLPECGVMYDIIIYALVRHTRWGSFSPHPTPRNRHSIGSEGTIYIKAGQNITISHFHHDMPKTEISHKSRETKNPLHSRLFLSWGKSRSDSREWISFHAPSPVFLEEGFKKFVCLFVLERTFFFLFGVENMRKRKGKMLFLPWRF